MSDADTGVLELRLRVVFEVPVPTALDERMRAAIDARRSAAERSVPTRWVRRPRTLVTILVATVLLTVAASPLVRFFQGWGAEYDLVYDVSTPVGQSVTANGYRVTLVRAYADTSSLRLAIVAEDLDGPGSTEPIGLDPVVTDATGITYPNSMGSFVAPDEHRSESWLRYAVPPAAAIPGTRHLDVVIDTLRVHIPGSSPDPDGAPGRVAVPGPWTFGFHLDFFAPAVARPDLAVSAGDVTVTLEELSVTPAATTGRLRFAGLPPRPADWAWDPYMRVEHDGRVLDIQIMAPGSVNGSLAFEAIPGFGSLAGTWTTTIDRFHRDIPDPNADVTTQEESVVGPWVLTLVVPPDPSP